MSITPAQLATGSQMLLCGEQKQYWLGYSPDSLCLKLSQCLSQLTHEPLSPTLMQYRCALHHELSQMYCKEVLMSFSCNQYILRTHQTFLLDKLGHPPCTYSTQKTHSAAALGRDLRDIYFCLELFAILPLTLSVCCGYGSQIWAVD